MPGVPRILASLREDGELSGETVAKLMPAAPIVWISPRRFTPATSVSRARPARGRLRCVHDGVVAGSIAHIADVFALICCRTMCSIRIGT